MKYKADGYRELRTGKGVSYEVLNGLMPNICEREEREKNRARLILHCSSVVILHAVPHSFPVAALSEEMKPLVF